MARKQQVYEYRDHLSIRPDRICKYSVAVDPPCRLPPVRSGKKVENNLSYKASGRLKDAINLLVASATKKRLYSDELKSYFNFKVNFITLTLPSHQIHSDKEIHNKVFKDFIRTWKRKNPNLLYVWKAEKQDNGNLHYHLTTNSFIHHSKLRKFWNRACDGLGYVARSTSSDPNSTDVHAVKNVKNIAAYLCAYVTKKDLYKKPLKRYFAKYGRRLKTLTASSFQLPRNYFKNIKKKVEIKLWDCSKELLQKPFTVNISNAWSAGWVPRLFAGVDRVYYHDYCTVGYGDFTKNPNNNYLLDQYKAHLKELVSITRSATHILN